MYLPPVTRGPQRSRAARLRATAAGGALASLIALTAALTAGAGASADGGTEAPLPPDLVTQPLGGDLKLTTDAPRDKLRLGNTIANHGTGPLEIFPQQGAEDCDSSAGEDRYAYQRVFGDSDGDGVFNRGPDREASRLEAGCMAYHPAHEHWHFDDFSRYLLRRQATGAIVADSTKVSFCVIDTSRPFAGLAGSPSENYYPRGGNGCDERATEGISVGWADTYGSTLPGQALDVTGLPRGRYCLVSTADPSNRLLETEEGNNRRRKLLSLNVKTGRLAGLPGGC